MSVNGKKTKEPATRMFTATEVAHMLHVHPNTIRLWSKIGVIKCYRIGKRRDYRFHPDDIEKFLYKDTSQYP